MSGCKTLLALAGAVVVGVGVALQQRYCPVPDDWAAPVQNGLIAGGVTFLALLVLRSTLGRARALVLDEVEVGGFKYKVADEDRRAAWATFVDLASRIATQPLDATAGDTGAALASLYALFQSVRERLIGLRPPTALAAGQRTVETHALAMLNLEIRPLLSRWHPEFDDARARGAAVPPDVERACRAEMESVRLRLVEYAVEFAELSGLKREVVLPIITARASGA
ncbi:hypothetical protein L6V77_22235 [Myxococcota bacterium]|nr:hypothetical protein [Myxococcota bacterium]